ncbi:MAG: T9SS type A sorting domain-containing protein [Bacteroidota bacterium]
MKTLLQFYWLLFLVSFLSLNSTIGLSQISFNVTPNPVKCSCASPTLVGTCPFQICNNSSQVVYLHLTDFAIGTGDNGFSMGNATEWVMLQPKGVYGACYADQVQFNYWTHPAQTPYGSKSNTFNISYSLTDGGPHSGYASFPICGVFESSTNKCPSGYPCIDAVKLYNNVLPTGYILSQNYPNPFNPSTRIDFSIPQRSHVILKIFNIYGEEVSCLINEDLLPGNYMQIWNGNNFPSGIYYYRLQAGLFSTTKKLSFIK